jgi:AcrR family transcriptional regulator
LTVAAIVDAACAELEAGGLNGFSIRRVAKRLGVTPGALYQHVSSKEGLLDRVADRYLGELALPAGGSDWRETVEGFVDDLRLLVLRRPLVAHVMLHHQVDGIGSYRIADAVLGVLRTAGFDDLTAVQLFTTISTYTLGFALHEVTRAPARPDAQARAAHLTDSFGETFPHLTAAADEYVRWSSEANFRAAVARLLDGYTP